MNSKILNYIQIALTLALIVFIILKAGDFFEQVDWYVIYANWLSILVAGILFTAGYSFMARHWEAVCKLVTDKTGEKQWLAFLASQPYKYLPTSIFTFSSRATFSKKLGMNFKQSTEAQVIENINLIGMAFVLGGLLFIAMVNLFYFLLLSGLGVLVCIAIWYKKTIVVPKIKAVLDLRKWLKSLAIVTTGWVVMGLGFSVLVFGLEGRFEPISSISANSLATGLGITAVFAPGGIGVREIVFSYLSFASATILVWRFTTFIVDILVGAWAGWTIAKRQK